jgi:hypothetical protein
MARWVPPYSQQHVNQKSGVLARLTHFCTLKREKGRHAFPISVVVIALRRIALCWCKVYTLSTRGRQAVQADHLHPSSITTSHEHGTFHAPRFQFLTSL